MAWVVCVTDSETSDEDILGPFRTRERAEWLQHRLDRHVARLGLTNRAAHVQELISGDHHMDYWEQLCREADPESISR